MLGGPLVPPAGAPQPQPMLQSPQKLLLGLPVALPVPADAPYQLLQTSLALAQLPHSSSSVQLWTTVGAAPDPNILRHDTMGQPAWHAGCMGLASREVCCPWAFF